MENWLVNVTASLNSEVDATGCQVLNSGNVYLKPVSLMGEMERFLEECDREEIRKEVLELYFDVRHLSVCMRCWMKTI